MEDDPESRGAPADADAGTESTSFAAASAKARRPFVGYDRELEAYERRKPALLAEAENLFVVFVGDEMIGPFRSHSEAEKAGYSRFGLGPLFIKQVLAEEPVIEVTRFVAS